MQTRPSLDMPADPDRSDVVMSAANGSRRVEFAALATILLAGLAVRLWFVHLPGYKVDVSLFTDWTNGLLKIPFDEFYGRVSPWCDYLPGYLYILALTGWLKNLVSDTGTLTVQNFEPWIKAGPIVADLLLGVVVFQLCRRFTGAKRSLMAASLVVFNPGIIFVSSVWGQVESVATALYMLSLLALIAGNPVLAAIWAAMGIVTKPQYAIFLGAIGLAYLRSDLMRLPQIRSHGVRSLWSAWAGPRMILPVVILIGAAQLLLLPFSTSLWPTPDVEWTFAYKVTNAEIGSFASAGAFNLWGTQIAGIRHLDSQLGWFHMSYQSWGYILFAVAAVVSLFLAWRRSNDPGALLWAAFLLAFGFFEVLTKMHERYLFTALPLVAAATAFRLWLLPIYLGVSAVYFVNVWYIWANQKDLFANLPLTQWTSDFSVVLFALAAVIAILLAILPNRVTSSVPAPWQSSPVSGHANSSWLRLDRVRKTLRRQISVKAGIGILVIGLALLTGIALGRTIEGRSAQANGAFRIATIHAYRSWQDTGVSVSAGQRIALMARGRWVDQIEGELYGPGGTNRKDQRDIIPSAPIGTLIGRIGTSAPFVVGVETTVLASSGGELQLTMNDRPDKKQGESRGRLYVTITNRAE